MFLEGTDTLASNFPLASIHRRPRHLGQHRLVSLTRAETTALLAQAGLAPKRKFGQNFVVDENITSKIARLSGVQPGERVLEIGPGLGALTEALCASGARVTALEIDPGLVGVLRHRAELADVRIVEGDALSVPLANVVPPEEAPWMVVANLPYNVATPVVLRILEQAPWVTKLLVMVQLEVGERMAARPGDDAYGAVSVRVDYHATAKVVGRVPPTVFVPRPNVDSALVALERRATPAIDPSLVSEEEIFRIVKLAFGQRRKMLRRSLAGVLSEEQIEAAGVAPTARPEEIDVAGFAQLALAAR